MSPDWLPTRLTVALLGLMGPVYFVLLVIFLPFRLTPFTDPMLNLLFHFVAVPIVFAAPWIGVIYYHRYRLANTVHLMQESTSSVPLRWRVFYGTNAAFVLLFFLLPLTIPVLALIEGLYVAGTLFARVQGGKVGSTLAAIVSILTAICLSVLPAFVLIEFAPQYILVWNAIMEAWNSFWITVVYGISQCLVNAISFGSPAYFIYFAASEYDKGIFETSYTKTPTNKIRMGEAALFLIFITLYLPPIPTVLFTIPFLNMSFLFTRYINWMSMGIGVIIIIVKRILRVKDNSTMGGASNIVVVFLFLIVEIFFKTNIVVTIVIWLAFFVYASIAIANYLRASSREMY